MSPLIQNVVMGKASIALTLSSTGAYSCVVIVILLSDNKVFIYHMDPSNFDLEQGDVSTEAQKLVKKTMFKLNKCNTNRLTIEKIYLLGGLDNNYYKKFNDTLNHMKENYSILTPMIDQLNINDLKNFIKSIEYSNLMMNLCGGDLDEARDTVMISDLSIILDRKTTDPFFCMVQYYGTESQLRVDKRSFGPQLMFLHITKPIE
jgi:hypothetical protein